MAEQEIGILYVSVSDQVKENCSSINWLTTQGRGEVLLSE